jgi:hypothetical protein
MDRSQLLRGYSTRPLSWSSPNATGTDTTLSAACAPPASATSASPPSTARCAGYYRAGALISFVEPPDEGPHRRYHGATDSGRAQPQRGTWDPVGLLTRADAAARQRSGGQGMTPQQPPEVTGYVAVVRAKLADLRAAIETTCSRVETSIVEDAAKAARSRAARGRPRSSRQSFVGGGPARNRASGALFRSCAGASPSRDLKRVRRKPRGDWPRSKRKPRTPPLGRINNAGTACTSWSAPV